MSITHQIIGAGLVVGAVGGAAHQPLAVVGGVGIALTAIPVEALSKRSGGRKVEDNMVFDTLGRMLRAPGEVTGRIKRKHRRIERISVRYPHHVDSGDPAMRVKLKRVMEDRLNGDLKITWRGDRCALEIERLPPIPEGLKRIAAVVEIVFGEHATVEALSWDGDQPLSFRVHRVPDDQDTNPEYRSAVDQRVMVKTGGSWNSRWDPTKDTVTYTRREALPTFVAHPSDLLPGEARLPFGVNHSGEVEAWDLNGFSPHALVTGATGSGKTLAMIGIVLEACMRDIVTTVIDPKRIDFRGLKGWPGVREIATEIDTMVAAIDLHWQEMEARYVALQNNTIDRNELRPMLLVIDELTELLGRLKEEWKAQGEKGEHPAIAQWRSLVRLGRGARMHLLVGMQRPDAAIMGGETRSNFSIALGLGKLEPAAKQMIGATTNVSLGPDGKPIRGRAIAVGGGSEHEVQIYYTPDPAQRTLRDSDKAILKGLRPSTVTTVGTVLTRQGPVRRGKPVDNPGDNGAFTLVGAVDQPVNGAVKQAFPTKLSDDKINAILRLRDTTDMTVQQIATEVGVSTGVVGKYTKGRPRGGGRPNLTVVTDAGS